MIKIVLAEDQHLVRESLTLLIEQQYEVAAALSDGTAALEICRKMQPELALLDIRMPKVTGLEAAAQIKKAELPCKIILLTTFADEDDILQALELGVEGYILKDIQSEMFHLALKGVLGGLNVYQPFPVGYMRPQKGLRDSIVKEFQLAEHELALIEMITAGLSNKEIAAEIGYTEGTVKNRVSTILNKMGLQARTQIAVFAIKNGLVREK